ncbi:hypothetical protein FRC07_008445 [Ceratobasidium sp. 392]|nr:hypothetical protein FRC07_008445 [Ceratobasidium sp. 392]
MPQTNAERAAADQPQLGGNGVWEDPPDPLGEEMSEHARVWKTYVREADRSDKEKMDLQNNSMDVLLSMYSALPGRTPTVAALFSAISTAFIIESLGDLKPDHAESSAQTLLLMSKTLTALTNGQPAPLSPEDEPSSVAFSPPRSAVIVNVIWLLSLSLSVAVSLIAMLAKDWCYRFMSRRSGPMYEQAIRRQQKWNGMELWKMELVLEKLPLAMHLALLLFAVGLCIYLWDISVSVAMPVVVTTAIAVLTYGFATIAPLRDTFCPYSTPLSSPIQFSKPLVQRAAYKTSRYLWYHVSYPQWLESTLERITRRLKPASAGRDENPEARTITSHMIAWILTNCDDSRSVDIALQALAGGCDDLHREPLNQCNVLALILPRLEKSYMLFESTWETLSEQQLSAVSTASRYIRTAARWRTDAGDSAAKLLYCASQKIVMLACHLGDDASILDAAATVPFFRRDWDDAVGKDLAKSIRHALVHPASTLESHFREPGEKLSATVLHVLVGSSATRYLVSRWPREDDHGSHSSLPLLLARVFVTCYYSAPDTAQVAALALAAGAFANYTYPGGEEPTLDVDAREKRAVQVLQHYQANKPDSDQMFALYMFGFYSWLPWFISDGHDEQLAAITREISSLTSRNKYWGGVIPSKHIWTMPPSFSVGDHAIKTASSCISSTTGMTRNQTSAIAASLLLFFNLPYSSQSHIGLYLVALVGLCHTEFKHVQMFCMRAIARQDIPFAPLGELNAVDGQSLLEHLCRTLIGMNSAVTPFAAVYFGLLVARIASGKNASLEDRQSALRPLLSLHDWSGDPQGHDPVTLSNLVSHLEEITTTKSMANSLQRTMQFVANFCSSSPNTGPDPGSSSEVPANWFWKLWDLKRQWRDEPPSLEELERLYAEQQGGSTSHPPQVVEEESVPAPDTTKTEARPDEQPEVVDQDMSWSF